MRGIVTFALTLAGALIVVGVVSLAWPKLTSAKRPSSLQQVRDAVLRSSLGQQAALVLGVQNESQVTPISVPSLAASAASTAVSAVQQQATQTVASQIIQQLSNQYHQLPTQQKQQLEQIICQPQGQ